MVVARRTVRGARALLLGAVVVIAMSVLGMHQLSVHHAFAAPPTGSDAHHAAVVVMPDMGQESAADHNHEAGTVLESSLASASGSELCPSGCDDHRLLVVTCLLALTLLVTSWLLRPPGSRPLPSSAAWRRSRTMSPPCRRRPALTLVELAVRRT